MIIDGKRIANEIQQEIKSKVAAHADRPPCLAVVLIGTHAPSQIYVHLKTKACASVGIRSIKYELPETIEESELLRQIEKLNNDADIDGILVQLPLPSHINPLKITHHINPEKDVDGFHPYNVGKMLLGETDGFIPCTPLGIRVLLERSFISTSGKQVLVIGRSNIVGKPMAAILMQPPPGCNATVTIAHRYTKNLVSISKTADIIISAIGQPHFLGAEMVKEGAVVIDVGMNKIMDAKTKSGYLIVGDVDFVNVAPKCSYITPVPGGVGPMTIAMLLQNTLMSYENRIKKYFKKS